MSACPSENQLVELASGRLDAGSARALMRHADGCPACQRIVALLARDIGGDVTVAPHSADSDASTTDPEAATVAAPPPARDGDATRPPSAVSASPNVGGWQLEIGEQVDDFRVLRPLGRGGMSDVYLARDVKLGRKVALKLIHTRWGGPVPRAAVERFLFEARATARFSHPNIVSIFGVGEHAGTPYVVLEYVRGVVLDDHVRGDPLPQSEVFRLGLAIAEALAEAHRHRILHRDLKPSNVILGADGRLRVLDFGLARLMDEAVSDGDDAFTDDPSTLKPSATGMNAFVTEDGAIKGTPAYMAPEQWRGAAPSAATDVWALGLILHELCGGGRPYGGAEQKERRELVTGSAAVPISPRVATLPPAAAQLIARCLDKEPAQRPSATEAANILRGLLHPALAIDDTAPFLGLAAFGEQHAGVFFGREIETRRLVERLQTEPICPVIGPSGVGKSSFVSAGLLPQLREQGPWIALRMRPGGSPLLELARALDAIDVTSLTSDGDSERAATVASPELESPTAPTLPSPQRLGSSDEGHEPTETSGRAPPSPRTARARGYGGSRARAQPQQIVQALRDGGPGALQVMLSEVAQRTGSRVLLFIDQLEEVFTQCAAEEREVFVRAVLAAADDYADPVRVVLTMREDFLGRLASVEGSRRALDAMMVLGQPSRAALREVIEGPLRAVGVSLEDADLADEMVADVMGEIACLPLLQFAAQLLWEHRDRERGVIPRAAYESIGGVKGALSQHADGVLAELSPDRLRVARAMLLRLVSEENTRRSVARAELCEGFDAAAARGVLERLVSGRLVSARQDLARADEGEEGGELELVHEWLIGSWPRLRHWLEASQSDLPLLRELEQAARRWQKLGAGDAGLWEGEALADAERLLSQSPHPVSQQVRQLVDASRAVVQRRQRRRRRAVFATIAALVVVLIGAVGAAIAIRVAQRDAEAQRRIAEDERAAARREASRARDEAQRARAAEKRIAEQLAVIRVKEKARELAAQRAEAASAEVRSGKARLQMSKAQLRAALVRARLARAKAQKLAAESRQASERLARLLAKERARVKALEKRKREISVKLRE